MAAPNFTDKTIWTGDNLDILWGMNSECVDLIYLDPPFNSQPELRHPGGQQGGWCGLQGRLDALGPGRCLDGPDSRRAARHCQPAAHGQLTHVKGMQSYLTMMAVRLMEMRRVLKDTGSIYLHCDPTASHYLKLLMDAVFGQANFRNEVVWVYRKWSVASNQFVRNHDNVLLYAKSAQSTFNVQHVPVSAGTMKRWKGRRQQAMLIDGSRYATDSDAKAETPCPDWWEISILNPNAKERTGCPTQKPLALLERIIKASSNEGDWVLDPFAGCATACVAAENLGRQWVGIDLSAKAVEPGEHAPPGVRGRPLSTTAW